MGDGPVIIWGELSRVVFSGRNTAWYYRTTREGDGGLLSLAQGRDKPVRGFIPRTDAKAPTLVEEWNP